MQISFDVLEKALAPIEQIGQGETTVYLGDLSVTLRVMTPEEEAEVQRYANQALDDDGTGNPTEYIDRMKLAMLSYAVVAVGDFDLRAVSFVETGDKLDTGVPIKEPKYLALRKLVSKWTSSIRTCLVRAYSDLGIRVEQQAEASFKYNPIDVKTEIERLEKRIDQLKKELENQTKSQTSYFSQMVQEVAKSDETEKQQHQEAVDEYITKAKPAKSVPRQPIIPQVTSAPSLPERRLPEAPRPTMIPVPEVTKPPMVTASEEEPDSFVDFDDSDNMQRAIEAENRRLLEARKISAVKPAPKVSGRRPPHIDALETEESLMNPLKMAVEEASVGDVRRYILPPQEVEAPKPQQPGGRRVVIDQVADRNSRNPNFRKPL
jgi:hypothetical protein